MISKKLLKTLMFDTFISGLFAMLAPQFFKLVGFSDKDASYRWFKTRDIFWLLFVWDAVMVAMTLITNTISVKYKMLSFKVNGAFVGSTLIFVFTSILSVPADWITEGKPMNWKKFVGFVIMIIGVIVVTYEHENNLGDEAIKERLEEA